MRHFPFQTKNPANGYTNGGFTPATLSVPTAGGGVTTILPQTAQNTAGGMAPVDQQVNFQPIRTIQPVSQVRIYYTEMRRVELR